MKVVVIGSNGQLGSALYERFSPAAQVTGLTHSDIEITDVDNVAGVLKQLGPDVVLNTAAYHNVPLCEQEPERAFAVNALGTLNLARAAQDLGARLVHYSTDYVFDGCKRKPYLESDPPHPLNIYGLTKLDGEYLAANHCDRHYIIRVSGIYGKTPCRAKGGNFITTMMKAAREKPEVKVVTDEVLTPTPVTAIAANTLALVQTDAYGLFHMTCQESCSWYEFAQVIFSELRLQTPLEPCTVADFPSPVRRPTYSVLENAHLQEVGLDQMPHWRPALIEFLHKYGNTS